MRPLLRFALVTAPVLLLCSCASVPDSGQSDTRSTAGNTAQAPGKPGQPPAPGKVFQATGDAYPAVDKIFDAQQEIKAAQSIEKDGIQVSYGILTIPSKAGDLQRLALIFRNMQTRDITIRPQVQLNDANGKKIKHYSQRGFIKASSYLAAKATADGGKPLIKIDQKSIKEHTDWVNTYWLKPSYHIPALGIAIGELVYYCDHCRQPLKLKVSLDQQEFVFVSQEPLPIASNR